VRDPRERLQDILEAIGHIDRYAARGREAFEADELIQSWFVRHLQIIGEAARALPEEIRAKMQDIPWSQVIGMRHILVHDYFGIDTEVVWDAVQRDLPNLREKITSLLRYLDE
jgi:uncharacterized protein with HEPN domain